MPHFALFYFFAIFFHFPVPVWVFDISRLLFQGFADDFSRGVLMNANCGGENCHRGGALGACLGAAAAYKQNGSIDAKWKRGIHSSLPHLKDMGLVD